MSTLRPDRISRTDALTREAFASLFPDGCVAGADLGGRQTLADYCAPQHQRRYVHMYFAKHVAAWSAIRARLGWQGAPLVSIGAGPWLDAMGWCWEAAWGGPIALTDPLRWEAVTGDHAWRALACHLMPGVRAGHGLYVPDGCAPSQIGTLPMWHPALRPVSPEELSERSVVLMPFVINHFTGADRRLEQAPAAALARWLRRVQDRGCRVVIADMHNNDDRLWQPFLQTLGEPGLAVRGLVDPARLRALGRFYPDACRDYRTYHNKPAAAQIRALVWDGRWYFLE